ncbi:oxidoreductase, molybdopterin binding domain protein [Mycobacterium kansasii 662]|uniref:Oxidoreductase, molybdopterin binding domain protein n=1 Tax=Mycobacterium kansasii 662 TaxID=1299326 RepID=X7XZT0_MYCKA|nr:oxidoreductase, molybdopterin binding domain protein [Mycobacterium kansasii 662]
MNERGCSWRAADRGLTAVPLDGDQRCAQPRLFGVRAERLPQQTFHLPIACVEGWSADAAWTGVVRRT